MSSLRALHSPRHRRRGGVFGTARARHALGQLPTRPPTPWASSTPRRAARRRTRRSHSAARRTRGWRSARARAGQYGYHGVRISDGAKLIASASPSADGSFVAKQRRRHLHGDVECAGGQRRQSGDPSGTDGVVPRTEDTSDTAGRDTHAGRSPGPDNTDRDDAAAAAATRRSRWRTATRFDCPALPASGSVPPPRRAARPPRRCAAGGAPTASSSS